MLAHLHPQRYTTCRELCITPSQHQPHSTAYTANFGSVYCTGIAVIHYLHSPVLGLPPLEILKKCSSVQLQRLDPPTAHIVPLSYTSLRRPHRPGCYQPKETQTEVESTELWYLLRSTPGDMASACSCGAVSMQPCQKPCVCARLKAFHFTAALQPTTHKPALCRRFRAVQA